MSIDPAARGRLNDLWRTAWAAERDFTNADLAYDQARDREYELGGQQADLMSRDVQGEGGLKMNMADVDTRRDDIVARREEAQAALRAGYVDILGDEGGQLIDELHAAIEACFEAGAVSFRQPITGARGEQCRAHVQEVRDRINARVGGEPILVDLNPND